MDDDPVLLRVRAVEDDRVAIDAADGDVRLRGWDDYRKQTKPWVESVFGEFQNVMRQNLAEYVPLRNKKPNWDDSDLDFVSFFGETNRLLESFVKTKSPEVKPIVINPTEVSNK